MRRRGGPSSSSANTVRSAGPDKADGSASDWLFGKKKRRLRGLGILFPRAWRKARRWRLSWTARLASIAAARARQTDKADASRLVPLLFNLGIGCLDSLTNTDRLLQLRRMQLPMEKNIGLCTSIATISKCGTKSEAPVASCTEQKSNNYKLLYNSSQGSNSKWRQFAFTVGFDYRSLVCVTYRRFLKVVNLRALVPPSGLAL